MNSNQLFFICHAPEDKDLAYEMCRYLEGRGLSCWISPRNIPPGREPSGDIPSAIAQSRRLILLLSEAANKSGIVANEIAIAGENEKPVILYLIGRSAVGAHLQSCITRSQVLDASPGKPQDHFNELYEACTGEWQTPAPSLLPEKRRRPWPFVIGGIVVVGIVVFMIAQRPGPEEIKPAATETKKDTTTKQDVKPTDSIGKSRQRAAKPHRKRH